MKRKHKRLTFVLVALVLLGAAAALVLNAFEENIVFFMSPSDVAAGKVSDDRRFRLGGLVEDGSVDRSGGVTGSRESSARPPMRLKATTLSESPSTPS